MVDVVEDERQCGEVAVHELIPERTLGDGIKSEHEGGRELC